MEHSMIFCFAIQPRGGLCGQLTCCDLLQQWQAVLGRFGSVPVPAAGVEQQPQGQTSFLHCSPWLPYTSVLITSVSSCSSWLLSLVMQHTSVSEYQGLI